jgi:hypothetical protein
MGQGEGSVIMTPTHHHATVEEAVECALRNMSYVSQTYLGLAQRALDDPKKADAYLHQEWSEAHKACEECIACLKAELASVKGTTP